MKTRSRKLNYIVLVVCIVVTMQNARADTTNTQNQQSRTNTKNTENTKTDNPKTVQKQLKQINILAITKDEATDKKEHISKLIEQLNSLEVPKPKQNKTTDFQIIKPYLGPSPKKEITKKTTQQTTNNIDRQVALLMSYPGKIADPLNAAESLYTRGNLENAGHFYQLELKRTKDEKDNSNKSWILFQAANSIRFSEPKQAYKIYQQLIGEFPNSQWTAAARAQQQIIAWYEENKPSSVLEKYNNDPNSL